ncbi:hypothetical protein ET989_07775 [Propioniciclava sinopodophylli]|uniref:Uncharacterized protein n=1 Tax=Propioniciclava sinopodophylli TaxID=1837344 RepID=A0A4Q9KFV9_9ACTN|nr:hypothetical protein [Propioniciclava sinopodophylli]TBT85053.1 hypothetical protein ET989_07775 [Propioniciclava sinopodophylli]
MSNHQGRDGDHHPRHDEAVAVDLLGRQGQPRLGELAGAPDVVAEGLQPTVFVGEVGVLAGAQHEGRAEHTEVVGAVEARAHEPADEALVVVDQVRVGHDGDHRVEPVDGPAAAAVGLVEPVVAVVPGREAVTQVGVDHRLGVVVRSASLPSEIVRTGTRRERWPRDIVVVGMAHCGVSG